MLTTLGLSYLAGLLTVLNPCVVPLLPLILGGAVAQGRWGPLYLAGGLILSFTLFGITITAFGFALGVSMGAIRLFAGALLLVSGLLLVNAHAQAAFARITAPIAGGANSILNRVTIGGNSGQFLLGTLLGAVWTPCVGPTLGAAVALAAKGESLASATITMAVFSLGVASVFLVVAYASRGLVCSRRDTLAAFGAQARKIFGWLLTAVGVLILSGLDKALEAFLVGMMPDWLLELTTRF